ncbi:MAG: 3-oxoacyl-ACP reductase FabG [Thermoplasmata archaeon]|nr:MAG: 3-oxoacyl-ACP reductase FabG [Thermoplasmata archaeon]
MTEIKDKIALITGSSRGIGRATALELAREKAKVVVNYVKNKEKAEEVVSLIKNEGGEAIAVYADVSNPQDVENMKATIGQLMGEVNILVNNAGIHQHLKSWELSSDDWNRVIGVNLTGVFNCSKTFSKDMISRKWGRIVNISSIIADIGTDHEVHYAASKGGVLSATKSLALELAPYNITVNAVSPGYIKTDMTKFSSEEEKLYYLGKIPLKRLGHPSEIADSVVFLCSDKASYITGQVLHVNGGLAFP